MNSIKLFILAILIPLKIAAAESTLCTTDEVSVFSCNTNNRIISLCGSKKNSGSTSYVQYRFGRPNRIELVYPEQKKPATAKTFKTRFNNYAHGSTESTVSFSIGIYTYTVHSDLILGGSDEMNNAEPGVYGPHAGVLIEKRGETIRDITCYSDDLNGDDSQFAPDKMAPYFSERQ
jgi:hypothetical protein